MKTLDLRTLRRSAAIASGTVLACVLGFYLPPTLAGPGSWTHQANTPTSTVAAAASCEIDGILYVAGGTESASQNPVSTLLAYDPQTDAWTQKQDMPSARAFTAGAAVDGIFYVIGGLNPNTYACSARVEAYDPKTDSWTARAPLPAPRGAMCAGALNGLIYVIGGYHDSGLAPVVTMECYDPKTDQWTPRAEVPEPTSSATAQIVNGILYLFAERSTYAYDPQTDGWSQRASITAEGFEAHGSAAGAVDGLVYLFGGLRLEVSPYCAHACALVYDPIRDRFANAPSMPAPGVASSFATIGGKIYIAGGDSGNPKTCPSRVRHRSLSVFDPQRDVSPPGSYARRADLPVTIVGPASCEMHGILYAAGGETAFGSPPVKTLYAYNPQADDWTRKQDMPTARAFAGAAALDDVLYVCGGGDPEPAQFWTAAMEAYDPGTDAWVTKSPMPTGRYAVTACALDGRIYAIGGYRGSGAVTTVEQYDPTTDQWSRKAPLPETAEGPVAQVVYGTLYVFTSKSTYAYDAARDRWVPMASIPDTGFESWITMSGVVDGMVYLFGGLRLDGSGCSHAMALVYDPFLDRFAGRRALPMPSHGAGCATVGGRIYLAGGNSGAPGYCANAVLDNSLWVFDPQGGVAPQILSLQREANDTIRLRWQGEAGRLYGVQSTVHAVHGPWSRLAFSAGGNTVLTVLATNEVVEVTGVVPANDSARFFRVVEAD